MSLVKHQSDDDKKKLEIISYDESKLLTKKPKKKLNVLEEDVFIKKLEEIIERDFFPDLERLKLQQQYQEALKSNDYGTLQQLYFKYNRLNSTNSKKTSSTIETPKLFDPVKKSSKKKEEDNEEYANKEPPQSAEKELTLDTFLAKNTSEDNFSFEVIMEEHEKKQEAKSHQAWLHEKEQLHLMKAEAALAVEGPSRDNGQVKSIETWKYTAKNTLMYVPDGVDLTYEEQMEQAKKERVIKHANTRFNPEALNALQSTTPNRTQIAGQTNHLNVGMLKPITKVGIDGKEAVKETPNVGGYSFVDASPSPMPGRLAGDESPMMTWGEIESTPFRLDPTGLTPARLTGGPEFKIPDIPEREKIALNLEEQVNAARRKKKTDAIKQMQRNLASPSRNSPSISDRINNMSPAAQRLLSSKVNLKSLTPSPLSRTTQSSGIDTPSPFSAPKSPYLQSPSALKTDSLLNLRSSLKRQSTESITDNLLKLPKNN